MIPTQHPQTSYIHPSAEIGQNVTIEPFVVIHEDVIIGDNTWIGSHVVIYSGTRIGQNCKIYPGAVIGANPQDLKYQGEYTTTEIGNNTTIRECVTINKGTSANGKTVVGSNVLLMAYVHIAHDCIIGNNVILANAVNFAGHIEVGDFAVVGGMCAAHQFTHIGQHVMISGGSLIRKDVPPFVRAGREPIRFEGINTVGLKRRTVSTETIKQLQEIYKILYMSGLNVSQAVNLLSEWPQTPELISITDFINQSKRGIMKSYYGPSY
ncbi:MAG: acyl-ACP--UDP-N-acetylglucosamine O-acyltransferase [Bacteroidia bacterium]|nr:acyl-ACP--UDP-N-acetylglucosamine O-acyltransferase [Bacteroidia bacterium]